MWILFLHFLSENFMYFKSLKPSSCRMLVGYLVSNCKWMEMYIVQVELSGIVYVQYFMWVIQVLHKSLSQ